MRAMGSTNIDPLKLFKLEEGSLEEFGRCMLAVHLHIAIFCRIFDAMRTSLEMGLLHEHPEVRLQGENAAKIIKTCWCLLVCPQGFSSLRSTSLNQQTLF